MFCSLTCRHNFITQNALHLKKINRLRKPKVSISNLHPTFNPYFVGNERRFSKQNSTESTSTYSEIKHTKRKIALWIGYLGTGYKGLQKNPDVPTLEGELEEALYKAGLISPLNYGSLRKVGWSRSSRTDKGVHALKAVVSMKLLYNWKRVKVPQGWRYDIAQQCHELPPLINRYLPPHLRVFSAAPVERSFRARARCVQREYEYWLPRTILKGTSFETNPTELQQLCEMFVGVHNWHNFTSARSHLTIFKAASTLSKDLLLHKSKPPRYVLNTNQNTQTKQKNEQTKENYNEEEDEDEDVVIENGEEEEEEEEEEKEKQQLNGVENAERTYQKFDEKWLSPLYNCSREEQWKHWTPFPNLIRKVESITFTEDQINGIPFVKFTLVAQSFLMHQIRAILGWILLVLKGVVPLDFTNIALNGPFIFRVPLVSPSGLLLKDAVFYGSKGIRDLFELTPEEQQLINEFKDRMLYPHLASAVLQTKDYELLFARLQDFKIPDEDVVRRLYEQYMSELTSKQKPRKMRQCAIEIVKMLFEKTRR